MRISPCPAGYFRRAILVFCLFASLYSSSAADTISQARIHFDTKSQYLDILQRHLDIHNQGDGYFDAFLNADQLQQLQQDGFKTDVVYDDAVAHYQSRLESSRDMGGYMTLSEIEARLDNLIFFNPTIVGDKVSIGQTIEGRDQWAVKISDNPNVDEDEPEILFAAAIHAREVITPEVLFYYMDYLVDNYASDTGVQSLVDSREIWFIVCVNPDGYYRNEVIAPSGGGLWRKNRRNNGDGTFGVDLNRNYAYEWGYDDVGSSPVPLDETYRGTAPFSEPETQNMRDFIESHQFVITVYYHSYSNLVLYPWGYDRLYTPDNSLFEAISDSIVSWNNYAPSPGWGLYVTNGDSDDWGYGEQTTKNKNLAFTFEVGTSTDGFWPLLSRVPTLVNENLLPNIFLTRLAGNPYEIDIPETPVAYVDSITDSAAYDVAWSQNDTLNPAISYELVEYQGLQRLNDIADAFDNWENSGFAIAGTRYHSAPTSFHNVTGNNLSRTLTSNEQLLVTANDSLTCWLWYDIEQDWDYFYAAVSTDGITYSTLPGNLTTTTDPHGNNPGYAITGTSGQWVRAAFDLAAYEGQYVYLRLGYNTDQSVQGDGVYIDDLYPVPSWVSRTVIATNYIDTSYTFTDKPPGNYFYRVRAKDAQAQWSAYSALVKTSVVGADPCVDTDSDGFGDPNIPANTCPDDNCPLIANPGQEDADGDGIGDVCDPCTDTDGDGYGDPGFTLTGCSLDNCPNNYNPDQSDVDGDGIGDVCDDCIDPDNDGYASPGYANQSCATDNCPDVPNPGQADVNNDGIGDACCCIGIRGNINGDVGEGIDISDLTRLIEFMFKGGSALGCPAETDIKGDSPTSEPDIADVTALVDYMFKSGAEPAACP